MIRYAFFIVACGFIALIVEPVNKIASTAFYMLLITAASSLFSFFICGAGKPGPRLRGALAVVSSLIPPFSALYIAYSNINTGETVFGLLALFAGNLVVTCFIAGLVTVFYCLLEKKEGPSISRAMALIMFVVNGLALFAVLAVKAGSLNSFYVSCVVLVLGLLTFIRVSYYFVTEKKLSATGWILMVYSAVVVEVLLWVLNPYSFVLFAIKVFLTKY